MSDGRVSVRVVADGVWQVLPESEVWGGWGWGMGLGVC